MRIGGFQKTSLIDFSENICAIVFTQGCNFKCGYCHNPELNSIVQNSSIDEEEILDFLKTRINKLDGVVITGGEPTLQKDLKTFIKKIKEMKFLVKLDTNGTNPSILKELINENLIDYVAMDIKAPLHKYSDITKTRVDIKKIEESIAIILTSKINYEFRTTVLKKQLKEQDFEEIAQLIAGAKKYYLQKFISTKIIDKNLKNESNYSENEFKNIQKILEKTIQKVEIR